jgi:hypothetical protein
MVVEVEYIYSDRRTKSCQSMGFTMNIHRGSLLIDSKLVAKPGYSPG